jgi:hypothetical protein
MRSGFPNIIVPADGMTELILVGNTPVIIPELMPVVGICTARNMLVLNPIGALVASPWYAIPV